MDYDVVLVNYGIWIMSSDLTDFNHFQSLLPFVRFLLLVITLRCFMNEMKQLFANKFRSARECQFYKT